MLVNIPWNNYIYGYNQLIDIPTRVTIDTTSLIDLFYVDTLDSVTKYGTLPKIADHDGILVSFSISCQKQKPRTKVVYDYKNADINGLINHIKQFDFGSTVLNEPIFQQADALTRILKESFSKFVPVKTIILRPQDQPWSNSYTRLLLRKKNRNYLIYRKMHTEYKRKLNIPTSSQETLTRLKNKTDKAYIKSRSSANQSSRANRHVKMTYFNSVNSTLNNSSISPKKKFNILTKLMKNNKFSSIPPLIEEN